MITLMLAQIFVQAFILCTILYVVARHEADYSFSKVAMVSAGITLGSTVIEALVTKYLGPFTILPVLAFVAFMIMTFCWTSLRKSILVVVIYSLAHVAFAVGVAAVASHFFPKPDMDQTSCGTTEEQVEILRMIGFNIGDDGTSSTQTQETTIAETTPVQVETNGLAQEPMEQTNAASSTVDSTEPEWARAEKTFLIGGIMTDKDGRYVALVNGKLVEEGDTISVVYEDMTYRWNVRAVSRKGLSVTPLSRRPIATSATEM